MRTLTRRELDGALPARQLLLERAPRALAEALERVCGIQAQYAPSMYVGLLFGLAPPTSPGASRSRTRPSTTSSAATWGRSGPPRARTSRASRALASPPASRRSRASPPSATSTRTAASCSTCPAPLPDAGTAAPARLPGTWDATLLVHARRTGLLPERCRPLVFHTRNPQSTPTFLVDGELAGTWKLDGGRFSAEPFERLPAAALRAVRAEGERLAAALG